MTFEFHIPIVPLAKQGDRVRVIPGKNGKKPFAVHYIAPAVKLNAKKLRESAKKEWGPAPWTGAPLMVFYVVTYPYRVAEPKKNRGRAIPKTTKPDVDNLVKMLNDALEGVCWDNDATIWNVSCQKVWDIDERVGTTVKVIAAVSA
jgi:Holliday junction resolvase RusA-like endonuclease